MLRYQREHRCRTCTVNTTWRSSRRSFCRGLCGRAAVAVIIGCRQPVPPDGTPGAPPHPRGLALSLQPERCCLLHPAAQRSASGSAPYALYSTPVAKNKTWFESARICSYSQQLDPRIGCYTSTIQMSAQNWRQWKSLTLLCAGFLSSSGSTAAALTLYSTSKRDTRLAKSCILIKWLKIKCAERSVREARAGTLKSL